MSEATPEPAITKDLTRELSRAERTATLRHAIPVAAPAEVPGFVLALLEDASAPTPPAPLGIAPLDRIRAVAAAPARRRADDALAALACVWKRVPSGLKGAALAVGRGRWTHAIARASASNVPFERESAAILIRDSSNATSAAEARLLLTDADRDVSRAADRALLSLAVRVAGFDAERLGPELAFVPIPATAEPAPRRVVVEQVAEAAWAYGDAHRGRDVLVAALLLADLATHPSRLSPPYRRLDALLSTPDHPAVGALRTLVRTTRSPELRARCLRWLAGGPLADAALERLSKSDSDEDHVAVLGTAHLAVRPARGARLSAAPVRLQRDATGLVKGGLLPTSNVWARLDVESRRGYALLCGTLSLPLPARRAALAPCLGDPDPLARLRAARASDPADLVDFGFDADARVARAAALRWSCAGLSASMRVPQHAGDERRTRVLGKLARSPHRPVRGIARSDALRADPWDHASPQSRVVARRWLADDRVAFVAAARERLGAPDESVRVRTVQLISAIGAAGDFESDLIAVLAEAAHPRAAATAAHALGDARSNASRDALIAALRQRDARVRANALEALARSAPDAVGVLVEFKSDRHHRVRGAAVRAEIDAPGAPCFADVRAMLDDARAEHRLAGVWVAERALTGGRGAPSRAGADALIDRLTELARGDASASVRRRATRCVRRVLIESSPPAGTQPQPASQIEPSTLSSMLEVSA